jgi:DNA-directed RNA polymerase subunit RPC12/RpoP
LICANCHREVHDGNYSIEELRNNQFYDEEIANQLRLEKQKLLEKTLYYCSICGKQLYSKTVTGLCEMCYKASLKTGRPTREELKQLIRTTPFTKIGEKYGVTDNAIRKWCKGENLPYKTTEIKKYTDEQWEKI